MPGSPEPARSTSTFWRTIMYAITGITGKVGGALAGSLLADRLPVRAVLRDEAKAAEWRTRGCAVVLAKMDDAASLTSAFRGAAGVFILPLRVRSGARLSRGQARHRGRDDGFGRGAPRQGGLLVDHRRGCAAREPADPAHADGTVAGGDRPSGDVPEARLVHGECALGRSLGARRRRAAQLPATGREVVPDGRDARCRAPGRRASPGGLDRDASRTGGGCPRVAQRSRPRVRHGAGAPGQGRDGAAGELGGDLPLSGHTKSVASNPDA